MKESGLLPVPPGLSIQQISKSSSSQLKEKPGYRHREFASGSAKIDSFEQHSRNDDPTARSGGFVNKPLKDEEIAGQSFWNITAPEETLGPGNLSHSFLSEKARANPRKIRKPRIPEIERKA